MAPNPLVVGAPSYGALPGRMRCGPYRGEERNLQEVPSRHGAALAACVRLQRRGKNATLDLHGSTEPSIGGVTQFVNSH